ncbi:MAG: CusA/CzcA family heavy metal efflux RND transporter [Vicinamibacterales bacterium]|jgi:cobalt-zinc-cadmium resistance protein CzcA|nr:CusA/CzcA family heavy metal efflux RND transporter [Vicinamibacterales bacterium]
MIRRLIAVPLQHKLLTLLLVALVATWGALVYVRMPKDIYPDLNAPLVKIITENPGMASEDVERLISLPLESLLSGAPGVTSVRSESTTGDSVVTVEFDWGTDIYHARQIVSSKLELIAGRLPQNTSAPVLGPVSSRMGEVFEFAVVGDGVDPMELRSIADWTIRYQLQGVPGVAFIINLGGFVKQYHVLLNPEMLKHHDLTVEDVRLAIERSNRNFSGGVLGAGAQETLIKGVGRIASIEDIEQTVVATRGSVPIRVRDVADVAVGPKFRREAASYNGQEAVSVTVEKQYGGDTLTATANLRARLARIAAELPEGVSIRPFYDQSILVISSLDHVQFSILIGAGLILLVMLIVMWDVRGALIASLTIPLSIAIALILMDLGGVALTVMSIGGLAIGIGKMANGSIIMVENIYRVQRERAGQDSPTALTLEGAGEVGPYLVSANLLILLVFLPLMTLAGLEGAMFRPTAFAVAAALFGSMVLNLSLQPVLCACPLGVQRGPERQNPLNIVLMRWYRRLLIRGLDRKWAVFVPLAIGVAAAALALPRLGREFVPPLDEGAILASTVMLPETSLEESIAMGRRVERIIMALPEVASVTRTTGTAESSEHLHPVGHSHYAIELKPRGERSRGFAELTATLREEFDTLPGLGYLFEQPISNKLAEMLTGTEGELSVKLFGPELPVLNEHIEEIRQVLGAIDGIEDLQVEQTAGIPQLVVEVNRERLSRFGISVSQVADVIETALNGIEVTDVYEGDRVTAVLVRLPESHRRDEAAVRNLLVDAPTGERIPLSELATITRSQGPQTIFRENMMRRKIAMCNVVGRDVGSVVEEAQRRLAAEVVLPPGYYVTFGGQFESQQRALRHLAVVMALALLVIFVVLFASFGSVGQALLIILNIPTTLAGGILALWFVGETINVSSTIGLIGLFGVCAQNDIILVAKINDLRARGLSLRDAIVDGSLVKFRAIFMTDLVMIVGVLPLALIETTGAELHRPLAVVYVGGFLFAMVLRRFVVPALYEVFARFERPRC